jgi:hypothetical protein
MRGVRWVQRLQVSRFSVLMAGASCPSPQASMSYCASLVPALLGLKPMAPEDAELAELVAMRRCG